MGHFDKLHAKKIVAENVSGGLQGGVVLNGASDVVLTAAQSGSVCIFDAAGASSFTLPAPEKGLHFTFITAVTATADHVIKTATNDAGFLGGCKTMNTTADQTNAFSAATDGNNDHITLNGTTTGGIAGSKVQVWAISDSDAAKCWVADCALIGSGNTITPFGDAQL
tara:strand:+ start:633 stop:1133 length:501 start_codon:yes stop_codon:yes gene_type:complete